MFQQAFGFFSLAPILEGLARHSAQLAPIRGQLVLLAPSFEGSLAGLVRLHTASHTPLPAPSTKNPSPCRSIGCASRSAHPYNDAAPAAPQTGAPHRYIP